MTEPQADDDTVLIYTDGACAGNPGPGGWGALLCWRGTEKELSGADPQTTNNMMELMAAIAALEALKRPLNVIVYTDSRYVMDGITRWIDKWKQNGWRTAGKQPVKNAELWRRLDAARVPHSVDWRWVKGHSGHPENERVDRLAKSGVERIRQEHNA